MICFLRSTRYSVFLLYPILLVTQSAGLFADESIWRFSFGQGQGREGHVLVDPTMIYSDERGFGFEAGSKVERLETKANSTVVTTGVTSIQPFYFSAKVPEGNYEVTLTIGGTDRESTTTVKAELRRLMLENVVTQADETMQRRFIVNVRRPEISNGQRVKLKDRELQSEMWTWDDKLTLEFNGVQPSICMIEIKRVTTLPTLFLLGDSTVCDQPHEPFASWGQMLPRFFGPTIAIANYAQSGESLKSSRGARRLEKVLDIMRPGDWLLIQFGHNDMKAVDEAAYKAELKRFVAETRARGGRPIIATPMHRRTFEGTTIKNSHRGFPEAVREVAREDQVPLVDLHAMSQRLYEAWGPQDSVLAFSTPSDGTHHNNYGAYELARCVAEGIRQNALELAQNLSMDAQPFDPSRPDAWKDFAVPASPSLSTQKPDGN